MNRVLAALACGVLSASALHAQGAPAPRLVSSAPPSSTLQHPGGGAALAIEALGGALGSVLGFEIIRKSSDSDCGEDLGCTLERASGAVLLATAGSALAAYGAGRLLHTEPSGWGVLVGAAAGALAGIGMVHLVTEEAGVNASDGARIILFGLTQGTLTGIGSRVGAALR